MLQSVQHIWHRLINTLYSWPMKSKSRVLRIHHFDKAKIKVSQKSTLALRSVWSSVVGVKELCLSIWCVSQARWINTCGFFNVYIWVGQSVGFEEVKCWGNDSKTIAINITGIEFVKPDTVGWTDFKSFNISLSLFSSIISSYKSGYCLNISI